jgi:purine-nucleoside phosphorylase
MLSIDRFTLIWTGIGTGCLEPLLYEILSADQLVKRIFLIGTAGALTDGVTKGSAAFIANAINAATPFAESSSAPNLPGGEVEGDLTILSTDMYYGFSPLRPARVGKLHRSFPWMQDRFNRLRSKAQLIDMETAQFYSLCRFYGSPDLEFAAFKGAANEATRPEEQTLNSVHVLRSALSRVIPFLK